MINIISKSKLIRHFEVFFKEKFKVTMLKQRVDFCSGLKGRRPIWLLTPPPPPPAKRGS